MRNKIYLLLGSNLDEREKNLLRAIQKINEQAGTVLLVSALYTSQPWGVLDQPEFLNQAIEIKSDYPPRQLLQKLSSIEIEIGREKTTRWGPRVIDIDILFYENIILIEKDLIIPHPAITARRFTLVPLCEIASKFVHPQLNKQCEQLLKELLP